MSEDALWFWLAVIVLALEIWAIWDTLGIALPAPVTWLVR